MLTMKLTKRQDKCVAGDDCPAGPAVQKDCAGTQEGFHIFLGVPCISCLGLDKRLCFYEAGKTKAT